MNDVTSTIFLLPHTHIGEFKQDIQGVKRANFIEKLTEPKTKKLLRQIYDSASEVANTLSKKVYMANIETEQETFLPAIAQLKKDINFFGVWFIDYDYGGLGTLARVFLDLKKGQKKPDAGNYFNNFYEKFGIQAIQINNSDTGLRTPPEELKKALEAKQSNKVFMLNKKFSDNTDHLTLLHVEDKLSSAEDG